MSIELYKQAQKLVDRIVEIDTVLQEWRNEYAAKEIHKYTVGSNRKFTGFISKNKLLFVHDIFGDGLNISKCETIYSTTEKYIQLKHIWMNVTGIIESGKGKYVSVGADTLFMCNEVPNGIPLVSSFSVDRDFQLSLILDSHVLKWFYVASILVEKGYKGRVKIDDTIVFTNMLKSIRTEIDGYTRIGYFKGRI